MSSPRRKCKRTLESNLMLIYEMGVERGKAQLNDQLREYVRDALENLEQGKEIELYPQLNSMAAAMGGRDPKNYLGVALEADDVVGKVFDKQGPIEVPVHYFRGLLTERLIEAINTQGLNIDGLSEKCQKKVSSDQLTKKMIEHYSNAAANGHVSALMKLITHHVKVNNEPAAREWLISAMMLPAFRKHLEEQKSSDAVQKFINANKKGAAVVAESIFKKAKESSAQKPVQKSDAKQEHTVPVKKPK